MKYNKQIAIFIIASIVLMMFPSLVKGDMEIISQEGAEVSQEETLTRVTLSEKDALSIRTDLGETRDYNSITGDIAFNKSSGELEEADFITAANQKIKIGNEEIPLPKGARFILKDNKASVILPDGEKLTPPRQTSTGINTGTIYTYSYESGKPIILDNGDQLQSETGKSSLSFQNGRAFITDRRGRIGSIAYNNPDGVRIYIDFEGKENHDYDGSYVSMDKKTGTVVFGNNGEVDGPAYSFYPGNPYGVKMEPGDYSSTRVMADPRGDPYVKIVNREQQGLIPLVTTAGQVEVVQDNKRVYYSNTNEGEALLTKTLSKSLTGRSTSPIELAMSGFKEDGTKISGMPDGAKIIIGNDNRITSGKDTSHLRVIDSPYILPSKAYGGRVESILYHGVSNRISYNYFDADGRMLYKWKKLNVIMDDYSGKRITPNQMRMLIDLYESLPLKNQAVLKEIQINQYAYLPEAGHAWAWHYWKHGEPGYIIVAYDHLNAPTVRHEMTHAATDALGTPFWADWRRVGGGQYAFTSNYGRSNEKEDAAEFGGELVLFKDTTGFLSSKNPFHALYRAKVAVLYRHGAITREQFEHHFRSAGLPVTDADVNRYINEGQQALRGR